MPDVQDSESQSLVAIDSLLGDFAELPRTSKACAISGLLGSLAAAILRSEEISPSLWGNDPVNGLFDQELTQRNKRFVGVCLIRLLASSGLPFQQNTFHANAYRLFDAVFGEDVYPQLGLTAKQQTFEKEATLKDLAPRIESELSEVLKSLTSLEALQAFRQSLMRALNAPLSKAILWPFLPRPLLDVRLSELFITAKEYLEETSTRKFHAYRKALETLDKYQADVTDIPTKYALTYLSSLATKLAALLKHDFDTNPLSQPATLVIKPLEKKYPLREPEKQFPLILSVLNEGPGHASNVCLKVSLTDDVQALKADPYLGDLEPGVPLGDVEIPCKVVRPEDIALGVAEVSWTNFDGTERRAQFDLEFEAQRSDIDWTALETADPYSLAPVVTTDQLVGRTEFLNQLIGGAQGKNMASFYVYGQKQVGKTSLVRTFETRLRQSSANIQPVYLEGGDYTDPDPATTVARLGQKLCERLGRTDPRLASIPIPSFQSALAPLSGFLEQVG
jgi:hypothetical protein